MAINPGKWYPIAIALTILNVGAAAFAGGGLHAGSHAVLAVVFGLWATRLRRARGEGGGDEARLATPDALDALGALEDEVSTLRRELNETQERLDFVERRLTQGTNRGK